MGIKFLLGLLAILLSNGLIAQQSVSLCIQDASAYPAVVAYEVLNAAGQSIEADFVQIEYSGQCLEISGDFPERIAVQVYEDENRNQKLDRGLFTQPLERYGFSNEAWSFLSKPEVEEMLITLNPQKLTVVQIQLKSVSDR